MSLEYIIIGVLIFLAGFIDSIAGGGGLITVPSISVIVGEGVEAIATNKIFGVASSVAALAVYWAHGHVRLRKSLIFVSAIGFGSVAGAKAGELLAPEIFRWMIAIVFPVMLVLILKKDSLTKARESASAEVSPLILIGLGLFCGFYDGCFGPGGGTLMFLSLAVVAGMPMLEALASSKLANSLSAFASLTSYAIDGHVHWKAGLPFAICIVIGSLIGSKLASTRTKAVIKPVLVMVVALLIIKIFFT